MELFFPPGHLERKRNADKLCIINKVQEMLSGSSLIGEEIELPRSAQRM